MDRWSRGRSPLFCVLSFSFPARFSFFFPARFSLLFLFFSGGRVCLFSPGAPPRKRIVYTGPTSQLCSNAPCFLGGSKLRRVAPNQREPQPGAAQTTNPTTKNQPQKRGTAANQNVISVHENMGVRFLRRPSGVHTRPRLDAVNVQAQYSRDMGERITVCAKQYCL